MSVPWSIKLPCTLTYSAKAEAFALYVTILESHLSGRFPLLLLHSLYNSLNTFVLGLVFSEAAAKVPTSVFLVFHSHGCKLQAEFTAETGRKRDKREREKEKNPHCTWLPFKVLCVYIS